jgi:uncharacterized OB-fold protein
MTDRPKGGRTVPITDETTVPFWRAAREGRLVAQRNAQTGQYQWPPRATVPGSPGEWQWTELEGRGTVWTFSIVYRSSHAAPPVPYVLAVIQLTEGISMISNVLGDPTKVHIGTRVRVQFEYVDEHIRLPVFVAA